MRSEMGDGRSEMGRLFVWPPQTCPRPSMSPRPAGLNGRLRGGIHGYDYVYEGLEFGILGRAGKEPLSMDRISPPNIWDTRIEASSSLSNVSFSK